MLKKINGGRVTSANLLHTILTHGEPIQTRAVAGRRGVQRHSREHRLKLKEYFSSKATKISKGQRKKDW
jgi:hypothetical protein